MSLNEAIKAVRLQPTHCIPNWEFISNPDFEHSITEIDPYQHPQQSSLRMVELLDLSIAYIPSKDDPISALPVNGKNNEGHPVVRWGSTTTWPWDWGDQFKSEEEVLTYQPLESKNIMSISKFESDNNSEAIAIQDFIKLDQFELHQALRGDRAMRGLPFWYNMFSVEELAEHYRNMLAKDQALLGDRALSGLAFWYNTFYMWPLLTFGYELFLVVATSYPEEMARIMNDFGQISLKALTAWSYSGAPLFVCHDDICYTRGTVFSPQWLRKYVYPWYERLWEPLHDKGIKVLFMSDGRVDEVADDIFACGADGIMGEPYTHLEKIAKKYGKDKIILGNIDNRVLLNGTKEAIYSEVERCTRFGLDRPGYFYSVTNHIPYNIPVDSVRYYFDACKELGQR